jgi:hypothetical protein
MRYRAILVLPPTSSPAASGPERPKAQQVYGGSLPTIWEWAEKALEGREGARVEVYETGETLRESLWLEGGTLKQLDQPPIGP